MGLPPLPKGAQMVQGGGNPDPDMFKPLFDLGVQPTNGYRTPGDIQRLRAQGYKPATHSRHLDGDAVDLTPGSSGLSMGEIQRRARALAQQHGYSNDGIFSEGDHVHAGVPGWGQAPGTPGTAHSGLPALPQGATLVQRGRIDASVLRPTGQVHDGDTFRLTNGQNARLFGADAFELGQMGRKDGQPVQLGDLARTALMPFAVSGATVTPTGSMTYGRPVATLNNGQDAGLSLLRGGNAVAAPEYLKGNPLLAPYMDAERQARLNRLGAWGGDFTMPSAHRKGAPDPWAAPEASTDGKGVAFFADEPTPFQGLRPEIAKGYIGIWQDMNSKPADLLAYAKANGFQLDPAKVEAAYKDRASTGSPGGEISYENAPRVLTNPGDGVAGTLMRGIGDPFNLLDEAGGVANALGYGGEDGPRENIWNSDRRFGDILANNIDQNRAILGHDNATHPWVRLGGQLGGALAVPVLGEANTIGQLGRIGALEGGIAGFGAGEGWGDRFRQGTLGTLLGATGGAALGGLGKAAGAGVRRVRGDRLGDAVESGAFEAAPIVNDGIQNAGPTPAARYQPEGTGLGDAIEARLGQVRSKPAAMAADGGPVLLGPEARLRDYIDLRQNGLPPFGNVRPMEDRLGAQDMARLFEGAQPGDVLPRPANTVDSLDEAMRANPGSLRDLQAPDEMAALDMRSIPSPTDLLKTRRVRGPLDMTQRLRSLGGIQDQGGELSHLGIGQARKLDFGGHEGFLGALINNKTGMTLDEAAAKLWDEGYFPESQTRPTPNDLLDRLRDEALGGTRHFQPEHLGEVDAFDSLRADRARIERAADEGSPLADRVGQSVDLNDLEANSPPLSAYDDAPRLTGKVGNLNLDHIEKPEDVSQLLQHVTQRVGGFDAAKRGVIRHEETKALAYELGMKPEELLKRQAGQALNAEQLFAARNMLRASGEVVTRLARKAAGGDVEALGQFRNAMLRHTAIQEQVSGATAEAGRALSQLRMMASAKDANLRALKEFMSDGEKGTLEDAAQRIVDLVEAGTDAAGVNKFVAAASKPNAWDKAVETYYNSLLSGPQTHAVNIVSNALTAALSIPEHIGAAALGQLRRGSADRVMASEIGPRVVGLMQGAMDGLGAARYTFKTGRVPDHVAKVEAAQQEAIGGKLGHVIRTPTRALSAEDEFFKSVARKSELASLAVRKARGEGLKGEAFSSRVSELLKAPDGEMMAKANDFARYQTFQRPTGKIASSIQAMTREHPWLKLVVPFVRTPTNILKYAVERSPAAPLLKEWRADMVAGGARRDLAIARATMGSGLGMVIADLASKGLVTGGGPADENAKAAMRADGWQPYSLKIGDTYVSYGRLDPLATTLGIAADYVEKQSAMTERQRDDLAGLLTASIINNLASKTWLSGVSDLVGALKDPMRYGKSYINKVAAGVAVPAVVGQAARTLDPTPREAHSPFDAIEARIPGLSDDLVPRLDPWGRPIVNEGGVGPDVVSPAYLSTQEHDPINKEALRLGLTLSDPSRMVGGVRLNDEAFHAYRAQAGQLLANRFRQMIAGPAWRQMTDQQQAKAFDKLKRDVRADVRASMGMAKGATSSAPATLPPLPEGAAMVHGYAAAPIPGNDLPLLPAGAVMVQGGR